MKLTPWFPAHIKPVHIGEYEIRVVCGGYFNTFRVYWDDGIFRKDASGYVLSNQARQWRGVFFEMKYSDLPKWDRRFLDLAKTVGLWSKGPRKHIGAVIVRPDKSVASMGYNGPPRGFDDALFLSMTREEQHKVVIHAEDNALKQLSSSDFFRIRDYGTEFTLYVAPLYPCKDCAQRIVSAGIKRVVAYCGHPDATDWIESSKLSEELFKLNNIEYIFVTD